MSESAPPRAVVVGSINMDVILRCSVLPEPGQTVLGTRVVNMAGGKGANQAASLAGLGVETSLVGCVGRDEHAEFLLENLRERGVSTSLMQRGEHATGVAFITVDDAGENEIVVVPGANSELTLEGIDFERFDVVLAQMEVSSDVIDELARRTSSLMLNVAPARPVSPTTLVRCAVVIANELESSSLELGELAHCVVTRGARGATHYSFGEVVVEVPAPRVDVVDTVGAGDVFCAAYASRYVAHDDPASALRFAVTAGALSTRGHGAQGSLPTTEEVQQWIAHES